MLNRNGLLSLKRQCIISLTSFSLLGCLYNRAILSTFSTCNFRSISAISVGDYRNRSILKNRILFINKLPSLRRMADAGSAVTRSCNISSLSNASCSVDTKEIETIEDMDRVALFRGLPPQWADKSMKVEHESFEKLDTNFVKDLSLVVTKYRHKKTGLLIVSMSNDSKADIEMCFDISVPTPPLDHCGCPHILEHSILEGSNKYPSKEAFSLVNGGLAAFINAMTYKDHTRYLFSSTNEKYFYNTIDYFLDAIFRPLITSDEGIFKQEAWHYKVNREDTGDAIELHDRFISYGGIVYSEMRMDYSDPYEQAHDLIYENVFTNSYKYDSGGNPDDIVNLEHSQLVDFYKRYYSTKTATIYFYGPDDIYKRLKTVDEYLKNNNVDAEARGAVSASAIKLLKPEEYKDTPLLLKGKFGSLTSSLEDILFIGWLLDPHTTDGRFDIDVVDQVGLSVLEHLLMGTPESTLYKALIESNIGKKIVGNGIRDSYRQALFTIGLEGITNKDEQVKDNFEKVVFSTLESLVTDGFKSSAIKAAMNTIEFQLRELNTGSFPKGLLLFELFNRQLLYGKDPLSSLKFDELLSQLKERANDPKYFNNLLNKHFLSNKDYAIVHMESVEAEAYERDILGKIKGDLTNKLGNYTREQVDKLEEDYKTFRETREKPEDPKVLEAFPTLELSDLNKENELIPTEFYTIDGSGKLSSHSALKENSLNVIVHPIESQGIVYMDYAISMDGLTLDDLKYMKLFSLMLKEAGTTDKTSEELSYIIAENLGDLTVNLTFMSKYNNGKYANPEDALGYLILRAKSMKDKRNDMLKIVNNLLKDSNFSNSKKGVEIIKRLINKFQRGIVNNGHVYVMKRMASSFSVANHADELTNGYEQLEILKNVILPEAEANWSNIETKLISIRNKLLKLNNLTINITSSPNVANNWIREEYNTIYKSTTDTFSSQSAGTLAESESTWISDILKKNLLSSIKDQVIVTSTRVNYVGMGGRVFTPDDEVKGHDSLFIHCLDNTYLFKRIRMALGAYGAFARLTNTGHVMFISYADPNFDKTVQVYENIPAALDNVKEELGEREFLRQKISKIGTIDRPLRPDAKAILSLERILRNEPEEFRLKQRKEIMYADLNTAEELTKRLKTSEDWKHVYAVINQSTSESVKKDVEKIYTA